MELPQWALLPEGYHLSKSPLGSGVLANRLWGQKGTEKAPQFSNQTPRSQLRELSLCVCPFLVTAGAEALLAGSVLEAVGAPGTSTPSDRWCWSCACPARMPRAGRPLAMWPPSFRSCSRTPGRWAAQMHQRGPIPPPAPPPSLHLTPAPPSFHTRRAPSRVRCQEDSQK